MWRGGYWGMGAYYSEYGKSHTILVACLDLSQRYVCEIKSFLGLNRLWREFLLCPVGLHISLIIFQFCKYEYASSPQVQCPNKIP